MVEFSGVWVPLVTPFRQGRPDLQALRGLVTRLAQDGVSGFVACASTGEALLLDEAEQDAVLQATRDAAGGRPVLMGLAGARPELAAARARQLAARQAPAGWLVSAPVYVRPSQAGLLDYFLRIADATPLPIVVYDIPARTGVRIAIDTLLALAAHPNIRAVKDCSGDRRAAQAVVADGRLALLGGNDDEMFDQLARGARGSIAASAHVATAEFVRLHRLMVEQPLQPARLLWRRLAPLVDALFAEPNPAVIKGVLARHGGLDDELRPPMTRASSAAIDAALACL